MGLTVTKAQFNHSYTDEPHASRRKEILAKYPHVKQLFGPDPAFRLVVAAMVITQTSIACILSDSAWPLIIVQAYFAGGTFNHSLTLAVHEVSHNMAYGTRFPLSNRLFGMFAGLPLGIPISISFKKWHLEHHRYMGVNSIDTDLPTEWEARVFNSAWRKAVWLWMQPIFYGLRPMVVYNKAVTDLELLNLAIQIVYNLLIFYIGGIKSLAYILLSTWLGLGIHPLSGHYISDHYVFEEGQETTSYYGPINYVTFNVGYHNEHHDFPFVTGSNLPKVREIAPEYYSSLKDHKSWVRMLWTFVTDPKIGLRSRTKRTLQAYTAEQSFYGTFSCQVNKAIGKVVSGILSSSDAAKQE